MDRESERERDRKRMCERKIFERARESKKRQRKNFSAKYFEFLLPDKRKEMSKVCQFWSHQLKRHSGNIQYNFVTDRFAFPVYSVVDQSER